MKNDQANSTKENKATAQGRSGKKSVKKGSTANEINSAISSASGNVAPSAGDGLSNQGTNFSYREEQD